MAAKKSPIKAPAWMKHGILINVVDGESPQYLVCNMTPDAVHSLLCDLMVASRRMDLEYMAGAIKVAFENGVRAEETRAAEAGGGQDAV